MQMLDSVQEGLCAPNKVEAGPPQKGSSALACVSRLGWCLVGVGTVSNLTQSLTETNVVPKHSKVILSLLNLHRTWCRPPTPTRHHPGQETRVSALAHFCSGPALTLVGAHKPSCTESSICIFDTFCSDWSILRYEVRRMDS